MHLLLTFARINHRLHIRSMRWSESWWGSRRQPMSALSPPLPSLSSGRWNILTWQEVRTWHSCTSPLLLSSSAQLPHSPTDILQVASASPGPRSEPGEEIMWLLVLAGLLQGVSAYDVDLEKLNGLAKAKVEVQWHGGLHDTIHTWKWAELYVQGRWVEAASACSESDLGKCVKCPCWAHAWALLSREWDEESCSKLTASPCIYSRVLN